MDIKEAVELVSRYRKRVEALENLRQRLRRNKRGVFLYVESETLKVDISEHMSSGDMERLLEQRIIELERVIDKLHPVIQMANAALKGIEND